MTIARRFLGVLGCSGIMAGVAAASPGPELRWETAGFRAPESVVYDSQRDCFYVSNLGSYGADAVPGDGFISKISRQGKVLKLKWTTGLEDPKGLAVAHDRLYVGDTPDLVEISLTTGEILHRHAPADGGPGDFNDCTADPSGNVYVYSSRLHTVFRLHAGRFEPWAVIDTSQTGGLNGLRAETDRLLLGGWTLQDAAGNEQLGHLSVVRFADQKQSRIGHQPISRIDGIEPDGLGGYTVTDWVSGAVTQVSPEGIPTPLMQLSPGTADHEYLIEPGLLIIPSMLEDVVRAFAWRPTPPAR